MCFFVCALGTSDYLSLDQHRVVVIVFFGLDVIRLFEGRAREFDAVHVQYTFTAVLVFLRGGLYNSYGCPGSRIGRLNQGQ